MGRMNNTMKTRTLALLLLLVMLGSLSSAAQEKKDPNDRGHWALVTKKTMFDGTRAAGEQTGIVSAKDGLAEFSIFHYRASTFTPSGGFTVDGKRMNTDDKKAYRDEVYEHAKEHEGTTVIQLDGTRTPEQRNLHKLAVSWTRPPQYVKVGDENTIAIDVNATLDGKSYSAKELASDLYYGASESYDIELGVLVVPEIVEGNFTFGFSVMKGIVEASENSGDIEKYLTRAIEGSGEDMETLINKIGQAFNSNNWEQKLVDVPSAHIVCDDEWDNKLQLGKEAYMLVLVTTTFHHKETFEPKDYVITQFYLYQCYPEGGDIEFTTRADNTDEWKNGGDGGEGDGNGGNEGGENEGTELPPWIVPTTVIGVVGGGAYLIKKSKNKKKGKKGKNKNTPKDGQPDDPQKQGVVPPPPLEPDPTVPSEEQQKPKEEEEKEKKKKQSTYKMILYKDFGDTLTVGEDPQLVGARIEEITPEQEHIHRADLTRMIEIEQGKNIVIAERGTSGQYRCARIHVPQPPADGSEEGDISFLFRSQGGTMRNRVIFNIKVGNVEFFQGNLTLPTGYEKISRLPFVAHGASEKAKVKASFDTNEYSVKVEKGEVRGLYYAEIAENHEVIPEKSKRKAGEYTVSHLSIRVEDVNGAVIEGGLPVMRYNMGLIFNCHPLVGCYAEPFNPNKHLDYIEHDGKLYAPAATEATYSLLTWDEEEHKLKRVVPADDTTVFEVQPLPEEEDKKTTDYLSKETKGLTDEQLIEKLGIHLDVVDVLADGSSVCYICPQTILDAPSRRKVRLHLETVYEGEKYEAYNDVWLTSQPVRHFESPQAEEAAFKEDNRTTDNLCRICQFIVSHDLLNRIGPVYKLAQMLLDAYLPKFGYDPGLVYLVENTYIRFIRGDMLGANATPEGVEYLGLAADLMLALAKTSVQAEEWINNHGGVWTRLGLGVVTLGWSETGLTTLKVAKDMVDVVNRPVNPGGAWEAFFVGVKEVTINYVTEKVWAADFEIGGELIAKYHPELAANAAKIMENAAGTVKNKLGIFGKDVREIASDIRGYASDKLGRQMKSRFTTSKNLNLEMEQSTDDFIRDWRKNTKWSPEEVLEDELGRACNADALKQIKEMEHAYIEFRRYRTPEAEAAFRDFCYKFQSDKTMQKQLALYNGDWANNVRSEYYRTLQKDYRLIDKDALSDAAEQLRKRGINVSEDDLYVFCATNSDAASLADGFTLTRDRDLSMMYRPKPTKANPHPLPQEVPQDIAEQCYGNAYKKHTGLTMEQGDQAVVQKGSKEMIGSGEKDLNRGFKKEHFNEAFEDVDGVATAFEHKPEAWIQQGAKLRAAGDIKGALSKEEEGLRQAIKLYFNSMEPRGTYRGTITKLTKEERQMFHILKRLEVKTQGPTSLSVSEVRKIFKEKFNMGIEDIPKKLKGMVYKLES